MITDGILKQGIAALNAEHSKQLKGLLNRIEWDQYFGLAAKARLF